MNSPRVFIVNEPLRADGSAIISLKPAAVFGEVRCILSAGKPPPDPMESVPAIERALENFSKNDFIVLVGEMDLVAIATAFAMQATGGEVKFLKWDRIHRSYFAYNADLSQLFDKEDA
jgi:hypothetical protein